eukprot:gene15188-17966_t
MPAFWVTAAPKKGIYATTYYTPENHGALPALRAEMASNCLLGSSERDCRLARQTMEALNWLSPLIKFAGATQLELYGPEFLSGDADDDTDADPNIVKF